MTALRWTLGLLVVAALVGLLLTVAPGLAAPQHEGRPIAHVMGWQGHAWLERESRAAEEDPDKLHTLLKVQPGQTVMDLGCGSGYHARRLARAVGPKGRVVCVDLQPEMLTIAEQHAKAAGITNIDFVRGAVAEVPVRPGSIDLALLVDVYHEFSEPGAMLASLKKALAPKGKVAIVEFRLEGTTASHIKVDHRMAKDQVVKELTKAGYALDRTDDGLPNQHLLVFGVAGS
ncbi:MAG: methyltransferase domain-containing protein [Myxococcota bacterium]